MDIVLQLTFSSDISAPEIDGKSKDDIFSLALILRLQTSRVHRGFSALTGFEDFFQLCLVALFFGSDFPESMLVQLPAVLT